MDLSGAFHNRCKHTTETYVTHRRRMESLSTFHRRPNSDYRTWTQLDARGSSAIEALQST